MITFKLIRWGLEFCISYDIIKTNGSSILEYTAYSGNNPREAFINTNDMHSLKETPDKIVLAHIMAGDTVSVGSSIKELFDKIPELLL